MLAEKLSSWYQPVLARALASEDADMKLLYAEIITFLAVVMENPEARQTLQDKALAFTGFQGAREAGVLSSDLYGSALTVAVQDMGGDFVEHLIVVREQLDDPKFASASASALGHVTDPSLLPRVRELALSDAIGPRETFSLLLSATSTRQTGLDNWQWVKDNFEQIIGLIPGQWRRGTPMFAQSLCSQEGMDQLRKLFDQHGDLAPGHQLSLAQTEERLQLCMALTGQAEKLALTR
jgi:alanyl aminopeptidase